jgi:hypothetical protein
MAEKDVGINKKIQKRRIRFNKWGIYSKRFSRISVVYKSRTEKVT